jgi:DNA-binding GntR family transcriptional regulator
VANVSAEQIEKLYELREALETQAARLAARRRDPGPFEDLKRDLLTRPHEPGRESSTTYDLADRLDLAIDEAMRNEFLRGALRDIRGNLVRVRRYAQFDPDRLDQATGEHLTIVDAILRQDELLAAQATAVHLRHSLNHILAAVASADDATTAHHEGAR